MTKKIIAKVTESNTGQRRVNIPKKEKTLKADDIVEVIKRELK